MKNNSGKNRAATYARVLLGMGCWLVAATAAKAQVTVVSLGEVSAGVNKEVIVPVLMNVASSDTKIGSVSASIGFDSTVVSFVRAEKGFLLDGVNGTVQTKIEVNEAEPAKSRLQFTVATEGEPRKALKEGLLLSLIFKINKDAPVKTKMPLTMAQLRAESPDNPPKAIDPLTGTPGSIEVLSPESVPYVACFIFSH
jgi:Cohesin domain